MCVRVRRQPGWRRGGSSAASDGYKRQDVGVGGEGDAGRVGDCFPRGAGILRAEVDVEDRVRCSARVAVVGEDGVAGDELPAAWENERQSQNAYRNPATRSIGDGDADTDQTRPAGIALDLVATSGRMRVPTGPLTTETAKTSAARKKV